MRLSILLACLLIALSGCKEKPKETAVQDATKFTYAGGGGSDSNLSGPVTISGSPSGIEFDGAWTISAENNAEGVFSDSVTFSDTVGGPLGRPATFYIAAVNASQKSIDQADYKCDGTADQVQIQAAINALPATGGEIRLSEGTFTLSDSVSLYHSSASPAQAQNIAIRGAGWNSTTLQLADTPLSTDTYCFTIPAVSGEQYHWFTITDMSGNGRGSWDQLGNHDDVASAGGFLENNGGEDVLLQNLWLYDFSDTVIYMNSCWGHRILNCIIEYNGKSAIWAKNGNDLQVTNCKIIDNQWQAIVISGGKPSTPTDVGGDAGLDDLITDGNYSGAASATFYVTIDGGDPASPNTFKWKKDAGGSWTEEVPCSTAATLLTEGVYIEFGAITGHTTGDDWTIVCNINNGGNAKIMGNVLGGGLAVGAGDYAIELRPSAAANIIANNEIRGTGSLGNAKGAGNDNAGIYVNSARNLITGNRFELNSVEMDGIYIAASIEPTTIVGNYFRGTPSSGAEVIDNDGTVQQFIWNEPQIANTYFPWTPRDADNGRPYVSTSWATGLTGSDFLGMWVHMDGTTGAGVIQLGEYEDRNQAAMGVAAAVTNPTWRVHSADGTTAGDFIQMWHDQTYGRVNGSNVDGVDVGILITLPVASTAPTMTDGNDTGTVYIDSDVNAMYYWNGGAWVLLDGVE